jgi:hypothetical protein
MRLEDHRAAGRERGTDLAGGHGGREVPRRDEEGDADRLAQHHDLVRPGGGVLDDAAQADGLLGVPAEELRGVGHLAPRVGERLSILQHDQPGQGLGALGHEVEGATQDLAARPGTDLGPGLLRLLCHLDGARRLGHGTVRDLGDDLLGGRVHDRDHTVPVQRLAAHDRAERDRPEHSLDLLEAGAGVPAPERTLEGADAVHGGPSSMAD